MRLTRLVAVLRRPLPLILSAAFLLAAFFVTRSRTEKRKKVWEQEDHHGFETIEDH